MGERRESHWLAALLSPASVAVVGASEAPRSPGYRIVRALQKYQFPGTVFAVNPGRDTILGSPCYPSLRDLPAVPDVAIVVVGAHLSVDVLTECADIGIRNVIIGSSGYAETGEEGAHIQRQLTEIAAERGLVLIGPNTNGVISCRSRFTGSFTPALAQDSFDLKDGPVAVVAQSGALGASFFYLGQRDGLGVGTLVNTGNEINVTFEEVVEALAEPETPTTIVLAYCEGLREPKRLVRAAQIAERAGKSICVLKVGTTASGALATAAHTANLAGEHRVYRGVFRQLGIVHAESPTDLVNIGRVLAAYGRDIGSRLTVASMSGGLGIMLTDLAANLSLQMADWPAAERSKLADLLPPYLSTSNPIDVAGAPFFDLDLMDRLLRVLDSNPGSDVTILGVCNFEQLQKSIAERLIAAQATLAKPLFVVWIGGEDAITTLNRAGVPAFPDAEACMRAISAVASRRPGAIVTGNSSYGAPRPVSTSARLDQLDTTSLLTAFGIAVARDETITSANQAAAALTSLQLPVVAKLMSSKLPHKSDVGGVIVNLASVDDVVAAATRLMTLAHELGADDAQILLQEQVPAGVELLLGMNHDATFGAVLTLGLGGVLAEALEDVQIRLPMLDGHDVADMLAGLRHQRLLGGFRGLPRVDAGSLTDTVLNFARLVLEVGHRFAAIDINPIIVAPGRAPVAVDALFVPLRLRRSRPRDGEPWC